MENRVFFPYRIEFVSGLDTKYKFFGVNQTIFKCNKMAMDINNIGTISECKRIIEECFPNIEIERGNIDSYSRKVIYYGDIIGYIVYNVFR